MGEEDLLDLARIDVEAPGDDQPLLAIDDQELGNPSRLDSGGGGEDHAAEEVAGGACISFAVLVRRQEVVLLQHVIPELAELRCAPALLALVERNLELFLTLDQLLEGALPNLHASPYLG